ncbi:uncharacterized protein LOC123675320 [Harmonia axyridis]|uniref:uncharacterized protein LOC123675320 n=1 Tax=Harmonia axyridis TaxID=115357 RepID=UPI001E275BCC|nr:uncharacterized protein LOC123675320 [Harmonia axyridis]
MQFKYLEVELSSGDGVEKEVGEQVAKAAKIAGCLSRTIWCNKNMKTEVKSRIYKAVIRPILTYTAETRPETAKTKRLMETTEMRVLRRIAGKTLMNRNTSESIRDACGVDNVNYWVLKRRKEWDEHISRMDEGRVVKIARDRSPRGRRSLGRPRKRWSDGLRGDD